MVMRPKCVVNWCHVPPLRLIALCFLSITYSGGMEISIRSGKGTANELVSYCGVLRKLEERYGFLYSFIDF